MASVFVSAGLLSPVAPLARRSLPEPPRWLAERGRIGATLGPIIVPVLVAGGGPADAFEVGAGGFLLAAALAPVLGVETKGGALDAISR